MGACITGYGKALPSLVVPNSELEKLVITNDEWIVSRTGIASRRIAVNETTLDLAAASARRALGMEADPEAPDTIESMGACEHAIDPASVDLVILTTVSPDTIVPSNAAALKRVLGLENAIAFDVNAACTGFIYGLSTAEAMMAASAASTSGSAGRNQIRRALVVSSERLTRLTDWQDRNTCVLFGDGAGAVLLEWREDQPGIMSSYLKNDDDDTNCLTCMQSYGSPIPFDESGAIWNQEAMEAHYDEHPDPKDVDYSYIASLGLSNDPASKRIAEFFESADRKSAGGPEQFIYMNGQKVFKFAARAMEKAILEAVQRAGVSLDDVDMIIPHQANLRIIEFAAKRIGLPLDKFQISIASTGNTSSSGVPMAFADAMDSGTLHKGDIVVMVAFGGGLTSGAALVRL